MSSKLKIRAAAVVLSFATLIGTQSFAQDAAAIKAAKQAMSATKATEPFDQILPQAAVALKNRFSNDNPNLADQIDLIVDEEALALAARRGDLETEAAKLFTNNFTTEELQEISNFFGTELGQKYLKSTPIMGRELAKAARIWANGIQRDLTAKAAARIEAIK